MTCDKPQVFGIIDHIEFPTLDFEGFNYIKNIRGGLHIVGFTVRNLADPTTEPIGLFYYCGTRRYVWRDKFWADCDVPCSPLMAAVALKLRDTKDEGQALELRRLLDILKNYKNDSGPTLEDHIDNHASRDRQFYRVIYEVKE